MKKKSLLLLVAGLGIAALTLAGAQGIPEARLAPGGIRGAKATSAGKTITRQPAVKPRKHPGKDQSGGPDSYGYYYKDERESGGPTYNWYDATSGTNSGIHGDDGYGTVALPFSLTWHGSSYDTIYPCTNGFIGLSGYSTAYTNYALPTANYLPAVALCPYWDDLYVADSGASDIYYQTFGSPPNRVFAVEWDSAYTISGTYYVTFEVLFNEADQSVTFQYKQLDGNARGQSATIGEQAAQTGSYFLQYSYDTSSLADGRAIRFYLSPESLDVGCTAILSPNGDTGTYSPTALIHNWGSNPAVSFAAHFYAFGPGAAYDETLTGLHLASRTDTVITFPSWHIYPQGAWTMSCSTQLAYDQTPANDKDTVTRNINGSIKVMIAAAEYMPSYPYLPSAIRDSSNGQISRADYFLAQSYPFRNPESLLAAGYKVVLTFADYGYYNATAMGDTLAAYMEDGGGVVMMVFGDEMIGGRYLTQYMPILVTDDYWGADSLGWRDTLHPIMQGVTSLSGGEYDDGDTAVRSNSNVERIADWGDTIVECATFDSSGVRTAFLGFFPIQEIGDYLRGQWVRQIVNAILWTASTPNLSVKELSPLNLPSACALSVAPNPFSHTTEVNCSLPRAGNVALRLYDASGALVRTLVQRHVAAGSYSARLDALKLAHGIYFLKLDAEHCNATRKLIIE
jgi:hypothetical protein